MNRFVVRLKRGDGRRVNGAERQYHDLDIRPTLQR